MEQLKDSEHMLNFLKDLSNFTQAFGNINPSEFVNSKQKTPENQKEKYGDNNTETQTNKEEKNPQSPTQGIADEFIQNILNNYLNKNTPT